MQELTRRQFLTFLGGGAAALTCGAIAPYWSVAAKGGFALPFTPVRLPHPLPIYTTNKNFLGTAIGSGSVLDPDSAPELAQFTVLDDVVVPPEFERYVILAWGDRIFPNANDYVGYNHDYTGYLPLAGENDGLLWVNHEYVSYPFSEIAPETPAGLVGNSFEAVIGFPLPKDSSGAPVKNREFLGECLYNLGGTVARIVRDRPLGQFHAVMGDNRNRRIHGLSGLGINAQRADAYSKVTAWGARPHQAGDENYLIATGPAANEVFERVNADGLGNRIIGTAFNCSGDTTPWGTFISTEENFQGSSLFFVGVTEDVRPDGSQTGYIAGTTGAEFGLVGEKYGWILEIDPRDPQSRGKKHTALGRFRHENVAMRVAAGEPLVVYSGDDRRGGHVWKFVSNGAVHNRNDPNNSQLLEDGTLFAAKFNPDGTGLWIPLVLTTPTNPNVPSEIGSAQKAAEGVIDRNGLVKLPRRNGIAGQTVDGGAFNVDTTNEATVLPAYRAKTLGDFYSSQGAILVDAFLAANLVGGTPTARPEDKEIHPHTNEVFIAFTDGVAGSDGYADSRIFQVSKYTADVNAAQPSGGLYKLIEDSPDGSGLTFHWQRFVQAGEAGAADGVGFANVDNLVFDFKGNVWGVTDMSTGNHNGFNVGPNPEPRTINHALAGSGDAANLVGVFGNNWLFYIPTSGPEAGTVVPLAYGPTRCEMTGPTFVGNTLIISVQHPGEDSPIGSQNDSPLKRDIELLSLAGTVFTQNRTLPRGSDWPSNISGKGPSLPKPATIGIRHKTSRAPWQTDDDV